MPGRPHSEHNEKACDLLLSNGNFDDWVVTTAFYSAIHLVDHQIFPLTIGKDDYATFIQYCNKKAYGSAPHKIRKQFVSTHLRSCVKSFMWLYDACQGARYNDYMVTQETAAQAKRELNAIKKICIKS